MPSEILFGIYCSTIPYQITTDIPMPPTLTVHLEHLFFLPSDETAHTCAYQLKYKRFTWMTQGSIIQG